MKPWETEATISDINPEIETTTTAQLTILNMAIKPLIRKTSAFEVSLIFNIELPATQQHKVDDKQRETNSIKEESGQ